MVSHYSIDNAISSFCEVNTNATRQECDDFAQANAGGHPRPVQIQGTFSYHVAVGTTKIFQFRVHDSSFDMHAMSLAKAVHPQFVASCKYHGTQCQPLHIYEMENLPVTAYVIARNISTVQPPDAVSRQRNTVEDLASFFAQSWNSSRRVDPDNMAILLAEFQSKFDLLARSLPSRFTRTWARFAKVYNHSSQGHITGIVDWAESRILPFGFALWGLENILGYMDSTGWHYYDNRHVLEDLFWRAFQAKADNVSEAHMQFIRIARMAGLFCRYGFVVEGKTLKGVIDTKDPSSLVYLDTFCTTSI